MKLVGNIMNRSPLIESLSLLLKHFDRGVVLFYSMLLAIFLLLAGINYSPYLQKMAMRKFHFVSQPFAQWALCQFFPSMYSFQNEILISQYVLPSDYQGSLTGDSVRLTVNHYPLRMLYFAVPREQIVSHAPFYAYARTVYRQQEIVSSYIVTASRQAIRLSIVNSYERSKQ